MLYFGLYEVYLLLYVVHGGIGEDGTLQAMLEAEGVSYTGLFLSTSVLREI
jgi:D-alanine-D-alanine ligase-like ATP-grasp enzyme